MDEDIQTPLPPPGIIRAWTEASFIGPHPNRSGGGSIETCACCAGQVKIIAAGSNCCIDLPAVIETILARVSISHSN